MCPEVPRLECNTIGCVRYVLDTNIVVAGLRSPSGASAALLDGALRGDFVALLSVALALEYEAVCSEPAQQVVSGLSEDDVRTVVSAICAVAEPVVLRFLWRPQLRDPADEMVLRRSTATPTPWSLSTRGTSATRRTGSASTCFPRRMH